MDDFSVHAARLSAEADDRLGDLIQYAIDGVNGGDFVDMKARIFPVEPPAGWQQGDEAQGGFRLRIAKSKVSSPTKNDRVRYNRVLGASDWRPINSNPMHDGDYWLVDLQKV